MPQEVKEVPFGVDMASGGVGGAVTAGGNSGTLTLSRGKRYRLTLSTSTAGLVKLELPAGTANVISFRLLANTTQYFDFVACTDDAKLTSTTWAGEYTFIEQK